MNLQEFELQYQEAMEKTLNELQTVVLLLAQLQIRISEINRSVQHLNVTVEEFLTEQKAE